MRLFVAVLLISFSFASLAGGTGNSRTAQIAEINAEMEAVKKVEDEKRRGEELQMAPKPTEALKESGNGPGQDQAAPEENNRKWWEFWED